MRMQKKYTIIGDVHGQDGWREIAFKALGKFRHVVFLGDYVDSFDIRATEQMYNLKEIIALKEKYPDQVTLLLGNHDWAYIFSEIGISGFQHNYWYEFKGIFDNKLDLFDVAHGYTGSDGKYTLMTHAGLTYGFYKGTILPRLTGETGGPGCLRGLTTETPLHEILNAMKGDKLLWKVGAMRGGGGDPGPLWADYLELLEDPYPDINQVFGHTASGTVNVTNISGDMLVKVDGWYNKKLAHINLDL
jgi:hypothetical protein